MEVVIFSRYIPLRDVVFSIRLLSSEYYKMSSCYFKSFKPEIHSTGIIHKYDSSYVIARCDGCRSLRRCRHDHFGVKIGLFCYCCQPELVSLSKARYLVDNHYLKYIDSLRVKRFVYFLKRDIEAFDFVFKGPKDRAFLRMLKHNNDIIQRRAFLQTLFADLNVSKEDYTSVMECNVVSAFIRNGKYGKRFVTLLLKQCYVLAKETCIQLCSILSKPNTFPLTVGKCLEWCIVTVPKLSIDISNLDTEKEYFVQLLERYMLKERNFMELKDAFKRHGFRTKNLYHHPYVSFGRPSIRETCEITHEVNWLHECTPFCDFVELKKFEHQNHSYSIKPDPYYDLSFPICIEAKIMVLSLGYKCPPFVFID